MLNKRTFNLPNKSPTRQIIETQDPTSANNYTWYRLYDDGFVEQGQGRVAQADTVIEITFPIEMATMDNYVFNIGRHVLDVSPSQTNERFVGTIYNTQTGFKVADKWGHTYAWSWYVAGMSARGATQQNIICIKY